MNYDHRQRRRRRSSGNREWLWKLLVWLGQAAFWVVRFWFHDRE